MVDPTHHNNNPRSASWIPLNPQTRRVLDSLEILSIFEIRKLNNEIYTTLTTSTAEIITASSKEMLAYRRGLETAHRLESKTIVALAQFDAKFKLYASRQIADLSERMGFLISENSASIEEIKQFLIATNKIPLKHVEAVLNHLLGVVVDRPSSRRSLSLADLCTLLSELATERYATHPVTREIFAKVIRETIHFRSHCLEYQTNNPFVDDPVNIGQQDILKRSRDCLLRASIFFDLADATLIGRWFSLDNGEPIPHFCELSSQNRKLILNTYASIGLSSSPAFEALSRQDLFCEDNSSIQARVDRILFLQRLRGSELDPNLLPIRELKEELSSSFTKALVKSDKRELIALFLNMRRGGFASPSELSQFEETIKYALTHRGRESIGAGDTILLTQLAVRDPGISFEFGKLVEERLREHLLGSNNFHLVMLLSYWMVLLDKKTLPQCSVKLRECLSKFPPTEAGQIDLSTPDLRQIYLISRIFGLDELEYLTTNSFYTSEIQTDRSNQGPYLWARVTATLMKENIPPGVSLRVSSFGVVETLTHNSGLIVGLPYLSEWNLEEAGEFLPMTELEKRLVAAASATGKNLTYKIVEDSEDLAVLSDRLKGSILSWIYPGDEGDGPHLVAYS